jgi:alpha-glucuronidase
MAGRVDAPLSSRPINIGVLYGAFHAAPRADEQSLAALSVVARPDSASHAGPLGQSDRSVERGYAGESLWDWAALPNDVSPRTAITRARTSIGINGAALTNVNANARADGGVCREGRRDRERVPARTAFSSLRFSAPTAGGFRPRPADPAVRVWWKQKVNEIYQAVPDFGGFVVKANSEGQPGPQDYKRTHADGANMLADALAPHGGVVMWRAFVYSNDIPADRITQAYDEFQPLDGAFRANVFVQVKNGPLDFQPREPFHPLSVRFARRRS